MYSEVKRNYQSGEGKLSLFFSLSFIFSCVPLPRCLSMGVIMGAGDGQGATCSHWEGGGGMAPAGYYDKGCGCITATGELEHQWLYLPSLMGRTENEVSRSVEKYPSGLERTGGKLYSSDCV